MSQARTGAASSVLSRWWRPTRPTGRDRCGSEKPKPIDSPLTRPRRTLDSVPSALPDGEPPPPSGQLPSQALAQAQGVRFGVYVHVPFCQTRCGYCDFNTYTAAELGPGVSRGAYADTLLHELRLAAEVMSAGDA